MEEFVRNEIEQGLAQSKEGKNAKENLVCQIEGRTQTLLQSLNSIESLTNDLNKSLLPQELKKEGEGSADVRKPQGWLENHLALLDTLLWRSRQIYNQVDRLVQATKTDVK